MTWDWDFAFEVLPLLLQGLRVTLSAAFLATLLALAVGLVFAMAKRATNPFIRLPINGFVEFIRRTPILVQIYFIYFVLPEVGILLPGFVSGIIALGLHTGAYMSEVYRAGIESVPRGQWEAAQALNYTKWDMWRRIILPQAIPPMIPALGNYVIFMFKDSSLLSIIAVPELMSMARNIGNDTYRYLEPMTLVAALYFVMSVAAAWFVRWIEARQDKRKKAV
ncbi:ectoine/hydroxyectoine ABC transporter permease subunit EhuD [Pseudochelatococcus sp. B33]